MKKALLLLPFLLTSCINASLSGNFKITETLKLKHTTVFHRVRIYTVKPGNYSATFSISNNQTLKLDINGYGKTLKLKARHALNIAENGQTFLSADELNQNYDINITMRTKKHDSEPRTRRESCTRTEYRTVCRTDGQGHTRCHDEPITIYGTQRVEYYVHTVDRRANITLMSKNSNVEVATFAGRGHSVREIHTYEGPCW